MFKLKHRAIASIGVLLSLGVVQCLAQVPSKTFAANPGKTDTERWVWNEILNGRIADLNQHCGIKLDSRLSNDDWGNTCRQISAKFVLRALSQKPWHDVLPQQG